MFVASELALDTKSSRRYRTRMPQSILIFDFGPNEEAAQQARHKVESWQQALRLGKKMLFKFEREQSAEGSDNASANASAAEETSTKEKPARKKAVKAKKSAKRDEPEAANDGSGAASTVRIRLLIRMAFSGHEKLLQQRMLDRFAGEEPFKSAQGQTIHEADASFDASAELFDSLD